jgi:enoyl-CoA hydratase/carnithine racemase
MTSLRYGDVSVSQENFVVLVEIHRPPNNYFDRQLIRNLTEAFTALDDDPACRAIVLASEGKSFCAGADFSPEGVSGGPGDPGAEQLYVEAVRLFACKKPVVAAIQGAAIGGGLGLALVADFRVVSPEARFGANFVKLGVHPGFGLTFTLPRVIGLQRAKLMFLTGRRITGMDAVAWGLGDLLVPANQLRDAAKRLAGEIAENAPLAVLSTRSTMHRGLTEALKAQTGHELDEQIVLFRTEDHREGVRAVSERRPGRFVGR